MAALALASGSVPALAAPLNLDFGPLGTSIHNVGAIDAGVNVVKAGNDASMGTPSAITFSLPDHLQVDGITVEFMKFVSVGGAYLRVELLMPNGGKEFFNQSVTLGSEYDIGNWSIQDPDEVTVDFAIVKHPSFSSTVYHYYALRIYASNVASPVPEPATPAMVAAAFAALLATRRRKRQGVPTSDPS